MGAVFVLSVCSHDERHAGRGVRERRFVNVFNKEYG